MSTRRGSTTPDEDRPIPPVSPGRPAIRIGGLSLSGEYRLSATLATVSALQLQALPARSFLFPLVKAWLLSVEYTFPVGLLIRSLFLKSRCSLPSFEYTKRAPPIMARATTCSSSDRHASSSTNRFVSLSTASLSTLVASPASTASRHHNLKFLLPASSSNSLPPPIRRPPPELIHLKKASPAGGRLSPNTSCTTLLSRMAHIFFRAPAPAVSRS